MTESNTRNHCHAHWFTIPSALIMLTLAGCTNNLERPIMPKTEAQCTKRMHPDVAQAQHDIFRLLRHHIEMDQHACVTQHDMAACDRMNKNIQTHEDQLIRCQQRAAVHDLMNY